ncbi:MAG TPA: ubiquinol-cytochrome c reductase iron-sulfur subunit [Actinomycetota bacterium]|nr:ubiquinol-cytochrome c reductase iron-sulfur subunit [Actinomycetota bacterium]
MSPGTIALLVVAASIAVWAAFMVNVTIRRERKNALATAPAGTEVAGRDEPERAAGAMAVATKPSATTTREPESATAKPAARPKPLTTEQMAVSRRQFLNRASTLSFGVFLGFFGMSSLSFLWPKLTGGFGTKITVGDYEEWLARVGPPGFLPQFIAEGRFWLTYYEGNGEAPVYLATGAKDVKLQALYRKCVHLGCSVPHCSKSLLFECPCHGSKYRLSGEYYGGPAPRGLDRFPVVLEGGKIVVDTGDLQTGPPRGTDTWSRFSEPVGPFCVPE